MRRTWTVQKVCRRFWWWDCLSRSVYLLKSFMKLWNPSSPKKSNAPSELPRWTRSRTSRPSNSSGIKRFQPDARMLYHFALSEHSCAARKSPKVFWSRAWTHKHTENGNESLGQSCFSTWTQIKVLKLSFSALLKMKVLYCHRWFFNIYRTLQFTKRSFWKR